MRKITCFIRLSNSRIEALQLEGRLLLLLLMQVTALTQLMTQGLGFFLSLMQIVSLFVIDRLCFLFGSRHALTPLTNLHGLGLQTSLGADSSGIQGFNQRGLCARRASSLSTT